MNNIKAFNKRFCKDFNLPINIFSEPYFNYYMNTYNFFPKKEYNNTVKYIDEKYNGNYEIWDAEHAEKRNNIIMSILENPAYIELNNTDMKKYFIPENYKNIPDCNIWNKDNHGKAFISVDLKKANFQALKFHNKDIVFGCNTYEELLDKFDMPEYFKKSKYLRQVIFGKLNPKRATTIEKYLMTLIDDLFRVDDECMDILNGCELIGLKTDELIYKCNDKSWLSIKECDFQYMGNYIKACLDIDVRIELFTVFDLNIKNCNDNNIDGFVKSYWCPVNKPDELKCVSTLFYPQVYKIWKNGKINDMDKVFYCEGQLATFNNNLYKVKK